MDVFCHFALTKAKYCIERAEQPCHVCLWVAAQIVMSANKEAVISEKELSCKFGQEVLVGYSEAMHPDSYPTFDAFTAAVQKEWDAQWSRVFSADWASEFPHSLTSQRLADALFALCKSFRCMSQLTFCTVRHLGRACASASLKASHISVSMNRTCTDEVECFMADKMQRA